MTRRPPFSAFSARTAPPISSADFFTTARPRPLPLPGGLVLGHALQKSLGVGADGGQRAFQVVGHAGHQLLLLLLRRLLLQGGL